MRLPNMATPVGTTADEAGRIASMVARAPHPPSPMVPGDDAAVLPPVAPGLQRVCTTDLMIEGVHFVRAHPPRWLGHKLLAANLSDVAAMGARPEAFVVTAALPEQTPDAWWEALGDGLGALAARSGASLVGGDVVRSPGPVMLGVTAWGVCERVLTRAGGRVGDVLMVRAPDGLGRSRLGLGRWLTLSERREGFGAAAEAAWSDDHCLRAHLRPDPDLAAGPWASTHGASAGLDLSDGLAVDLPRLAAASGVRLIVDLDRLPPDPACDALSADERAAGGEDYALAVLVPAEHASSFEERGFARLGVAETGTGVEWRRGGRAVTLQAASFQHFGAQR